MPARHADPAAARRGGRGTGAPAPPESGSAAGTVPSATAAGSAAGCHRAMPRDPCRGRETGSLS